MKNLNGDYYRSGVYVNSYSYSNTSEAFELYDDYDETALMRKRRKKAEKQIVKSTEETPMVLLKIGTAVAVISVLAVAYLCIVAGNNLREREVLGMREKLETMSQNNAYLETKLNESIDLKRIEEMAGTRLGMAKPQSYQIKYIDVQRESYTVQYKNDKREKTGFADIWRSLFKD